MLGEETFVKFTPAVTKWGSHSLSPKMPPPLKSWKGVVLTHQEGRGGKASSLWVQELRANPLPGLLQLESCCTPLQLGMMETLQMGPSNRRFTLNRRFKQEISILTLSITTEYLRLWAASSPTPFPPHFPCFAPQVPQAQGLFRQLFPTCNYFLPSVANLQWPRAVIARMCQEKAATGIQCANKRGCQGDTSAPSPREICLTQ